jgi:pyruvate dehydrogenase E2 component (dihydrolipoamide acetyltransferase)
MKVTVNIKMPKWELTMKEGKITRWFKQEGDSVEQGDDLFEVEAKNITRKVESPTDGVLSQILILAGKKVPVKVVVAFLTEP